MVADAQTHPPRGAEGEQPLTDETQHPQGGFRRLVGSATRLASLQVKIWLTQTKLVVKKIAIGTGLFLGAAVFGVLAVIFLLIGLFKFVADYLGVPVWGTYLIFFGVLLVIAGLMAFLGARQFASDKDDDDDDDDRKHKHHDKHHGEGRK